MAGRRKRAVLKVGGPDWESASRSFLLTVENVDVMLGPVESTRRALRLSFVYKSWLTFRKYCYLALAERAGWDFDKKPGNNAARKQIGGAVTKFVGSKANYERRIRRVCFARMIHVLNENVPALSKECREIVAGAALSGCQRGKMVLGWVEFSPSWDATTLRECGRYRRQSLPFDKIESLADLDDYVKELVESTPLACRRLVKRYVLERRYFCDYYADAEMLRAIDCSFKYTGSSYAFRLAVERRCMRLPRLVPEIFFKKAGQKVRERKYAPWLREIEVTGVDLADSIVHATDAERAALGSWSALERLSAAWHEEQVRRQKAQASAAGPPFDFEVGIPESWHADGYDFAILASPAEMAQEGAAMHHCIGTYSFSVRAGTYVVYRVEGKRERATVGFRKERGRWALDQARRARNAVPSERLVAACRTLVPGFDIFGVFFKRRGGGV